MKTIKLGRIFGSRNSLYLGKSLSLVSGHDRYLYLLRLGGHNIINIVRLKPIQKNG